MLLELPSPTSEPTYLAVDTSELPAPAGVVEEGSKVKAVVIRTVALGVVGRCQRGHLVTVD